MINTAVFYQNGNHFEIALNFHKSPNEVTVACVCIVYKVSRSNSDRMVITTEKITKMVAILKLCIIFTKYFASTRHTSTQMC